MNRWSFYPRRTQWLVGLSQLACVGTLGLLLTPWWHRYDAVLDGAFIVSLAVFTLAATGIASQTRGMHRVVFGAFAAVAALILLGQVGADLARDTVLYQAMHAVGGLEKAIMVATLNALLPLYAGSALAAHQEVALALARTVDAERAIGVVLEQRVTERTAELEETQRVLQRMWMLGQQISSELDSTRVLQRFVDAAIDIAHADGAAVGIVGADGVIRVPISRGTMAAAAGAKIALAGSAMGRVIATGKPWLCFDAAEHLDQVNVAAYERVSGALRGVVVFPISRRGEHLGAVMLTKSTPYEFPPLTMGRVGAMADLLRVALENAELVEALRQTEWRFRTLFQSAPDAVFTVFRDGRIGEANDAARDIVGIDTVRIVGRVLSELAADADRERLEHALLETFDGRPARIEITFRNATSGAPHAVSLAASLLPAADPDSVLVVARDVTKEREMRVRLMESDRLAAVGELVAGVAHEVNNPLSSISAFAQLLLRDPTLDAAHREQVEVIRSETMRASQVVKDLLAFARRSEPRREPLDLNMVVARTLRLRAYQLASCRVQAVESLDKALPYVIGDPRQLQQVCVNLIDNALQAMAPLGGGRLAVTTRRSGEIAVLEVSDNGPGMASDVRARVFEPFFTTKAEGEGTGLGLSVSYGIVAAHGGTIEVAETSAMGTTFRVSLPEADSPPLSGGPAEPMPPALRSPLSGLRILFVDDEPAIRSGMEAYGQMRGFKVISASDGEEALEIVRQTSVDAVVSDIRMPGMDGSAFHNWMRLERPGLAERTVFITGDVLRAGTRSASRQPIIAKPFTFERLEDAIVSVLRGHVVEHGRVSPATGIERMQ
jgi:two-component system, NtrC family, sensor kinase